MSKIVPSKIAPEGLKEVTFGNGTVDVSGGSYETDDRALLDNAESHPWLSVEVDPGAQVEIRERPGTIAYEDDAHTARNNAIAFDPKEIAKVEDPKFEAVENVPAIEAGLNQDKTSKTQGVVQTLGAAEKTPAKAVEAKPVAAFTPVTPKDDNN